MKRIVRRAAIIAATIAIGLPTYAFFEWSKTGCPMENRIFGALSLMVFLGILGWCIVQWIKEFLQ